MLDEEQNWKVVDDRAIEILCKLVTTVGEGIKSRDILDKYFQGMQLIYEDKSRNSRMRYLLVEVIELRRNNWAGRKATTQKNAYIPGSILKCIPPATPVIRTINTSVRGMTSSASTPDVSGRNNRSNSGSASNSPMDTRSSSATQTGSLAQSSIAPTLFSPSTKVSPVRQGSPSIPLAPSVASPALPPSAGSSPVVMGGKALRRPSGGDGSFDATSWRSPSPSTAASGGTPSGKGTPSVEKRRVDIGGAIDDYLDLEPSHPDAEQCLDDLRQCTASDVMTKFLNQVVESRPSKLSSLLGLVEVMCPFLSNFKEDCEAAVSSFEPFQVLGDTMLDFKEAPENLGAFAGVAIAGGVLDKSSVVNMCDGFLAASLEDEYASPDTGPAFARFKEAASI